MTSSEIRAKARQQLGGKIFSNNWLLALVVCLIVEGIIGIASSLFFVGSLIVTGPLYVGMATIFLSLIRKNESIKIEKCFSGFTKDFSRNLLVGILQILFVFLWSLLFIIPGIIMGLAYSMSFYIAHDHPEYDAKKCLDESKRLMKGHKGQLFCLMLSFIGWIIVGMLCCGIGLLWVIPYMQAAEANFYESIREPLDSENAGNDGFSEQQSAGNDDQSSDDSGTIQL